MLEIVNVRHGAVLNHHHGRESAAGLEFEIQGIADSRAAVTVNGAAAERDDRNFRAVVLLTGKINQVTVNSHSKFGDESRTLCLVWDKASFKRCNFFIDDNVFFLTDLARQKPRSLFEHFYLKKLREIHHATGMKFTLNCFFRNDHDPFEISAVPDCWKSEWRDNSDWLRLSFHARSEFPDRPYQHADAGTLAADFDLVRGEIERFAGPEAWIAPLVIHWAMTPPDNFDVLKQRGVRMLSGAYLESRVRVGEAAATVPVSDIGFYCEQDVGHYLLKRKFWYDADAELFFVHSAVCCNLDPTAVLLAELQRIDAESSNDILSLLTHEQYSFPRYANYIPDHLDRVMAVCRKARELGYEPVFFSDGLAGNTAWQTL